MLCFRSHGLYDIVPYMSFTQILTYILALLLIGFTLWNIRNLMVSRKKRQASQVAYQQVMGKLEQEAVAYLHDNGLVCTEHHPFVNDSDAAILLCLDDQHKTAVLFTAGEASKFSYDQVRGCTVTTEADKPKGGKIASVTGTIRLKGMDDICVCFSSKPHSRNGILGKFIINMAEEFAQVVNSLGNRTISE